MSNYTKDKTEVEKQCGDFKLVTVTTGFPEFISQQLDVLQTQLPEEDQFLFAEYLLYEAAIRYEKQISNPSVSDYLFNMSGEFKSRNRVAEDSLSGSGPELTFVNSDSD